MSINEFINKALRVPFVDKGRDYSGWDCYGLIFVGYRDVLGEYLPSYEDEYVDAGNTVASRRILRDLMLAGKKGWERVGKAEAMDIVMLTLGAECFHVGMMIGRNDFIHAEKKIGTVIERVNYAMWRNRVEGFYRLRGCNA